MASRHGLGKGLQALIPVEESGEIKKGETIHISLDKIRANPDQPRTSFDEEALRELADSIREHGVIQPIIVEDAGDGTYTLIAGERRSRAAGMAGLSEIPALIRSYTEERRIEIAIVENIQRADLNPIEEARAYKKLMGITGLSQDEVAVKVGKNRSTVANAIRLLKLPENVQEALKNSGITGGHARAILSIQGSAGQKQLFSQIIKSGLSVRESEKLAARINAQAGEDKPKKAKSKIEADLAVMEEKFIETLGTKVSIQGNFERGVIRIDYYSMDDLDRLHNILTTGK